MNSYDVIIVGGGLAGLTAALHLARENYAILVLEKQAYPHHKVCGEYVSNEITGYLDHLGVSLSRTKAVSIDTLQLTTKKGKAIQAKLPMGGKGISRFTFDALLYQKAVALDVSFVFESADQIAYAADIFTITTSSGKVFISRSVIGAYGKRDHLDKQLGRDFIQKKSSWLGIKGHYQYEKFPDNVVALHNFRGGYGGLSKTETGAVNFCYLVSYESFKKEKDIESFNHNVVSENPFLASFLTEAKPIFNQPLSIAQVSFHPKRAVEGHILMCGDTAGLIHPLCGNGMAMAVHSAKIASELICNYFNNRDYSRIQLEKEYRERWNSAFRERLKMGRRLQSLLLNETLSELAMGTLAKSPWLLDKLIRKTHGKSISG